MIHFQAFRKEHILVNVITRGIRNAFRNGIRTFSITIILSLSIALALAMVLARGAVQKKIESVKSSIGTQVTIAPAGVQGFEGGGEPLKSETIDQLKNIKHVESVSVTLQDQLNSEKTSLKPAIDAGTLGKRFFSGGAGGTMVSPDGQQKEFSLPVRVSAASDLTQSQAAKDGVVNLTGGEVFDTETTENVAIIGKALAEKNELKVGSTFKAYDVDVKVVGIYDASNNFNNGAVVMPVKTLQKLSGQDGQVGGATVKVDSVTNVAATTAAVKEKLGDTADVTSKENETQAALQPLENVKTVSLFSLIGAIVAGAVIILLTMIMIVRERRREIGVLKAIGASNLKVMFQFMSEAVTFTLIAAAIGIVLGIVGGNPITKVMVNNSSSGTTASAPSGGQPQMVIQGGPAAPQGGSGNASEPRGLVGNLGLSKQNLKDVNAVVGWNILLYGLGAALVIAIAGSAVAALLIAKIRPAEVMRAE